MRGTGARGESSGEVLAPLILGCISRGVGIPGFPIVRLPHSQPAAAHPAGGLISSGGQQQASESLAIVADRHRGGLRRCPRLTAGVHLVIVQLLVVVRLLGVLAACQVQLADRGRAVAGAAGGVQGGGTPPWEWVPPPLLLPPDPTDADHQRPPVRPPFERAHGPLSPLCMSM